MKSLLERIQGGLRQMHWLSLLTGVLLFALLNLFLSLFIVTPPPATTGGPHTDTGGSSHAEMWVNVLAAVLSIGIAPYLLRTIDRMQQHVARQNTELKSLRAIDNALNRQLNLAAILEIAVKECTLAVDGEMGALWLLDPADPVRVEARVYYNVPPARQHLMAAHVKQTAADAVRRTGLPVRLTELDTTWAEDHDAMLLKLRSAITIPIKQQDQILALLTIGNRSTISPLAGFTDDDEALLVAIASSLSVAVQNARLYEETQHRGELLRNLVARTGEAIAASSDAPRLMEIFAGEAARVVKCPRVAVYAFVERPPQTPPIAQVEFQPLAFHDETAGSESLPLSFQQPLFLDPDRLLPNAQAVNGAGNAPSYVGSVCAALGLRPDEVPLLNAPGYLSVLRSRDQTGIGLLCLLDRTPHPASADRDAFAEALAAQAAVSLENARLGEQLRLTHARDKHIAETFQQHMLPSVPERVGAFEFAKKYKSALEESMLGGDFYDVFSLGGDLWGIVMADVSGKGLKAAVQTAMVKYMLRGFANETPLAPGDVLARVNSVLSRDIAQFEGFVTLFFGVLDTRTGDFVFANAGHEPPLWRDGATRAVSLLEADSGLPLGCLPNMEYECGKRRFAPDDLMLLYTDGLSEARGSDNNLLGTDGLRRSVPGHGDSAQSEIEAIYDQVRLFADDHLRDDVAMLLLRRSPAVSPPALLAS